MGAPLEIARDAAVVVLLLSGSFFVTVAAIGLVRFPDVYCRMHAAGKAGTLGIALLILGAATFFAPSEPFVAVRGGLAIVFQMLTTPGATYLLAHASYATNQPRHERTEMDELRDFAPVYPDDEWGHE